MKTITVKSDDNGIVMEWNLEGSGKCEAGTNNPFLENCLKSFAEASSIDLKLICSKDIGGEELMGAMGIYLLKLSVSSVWNWKSMAGQEAGLQTMPFSPPAVSSCFRAGRTGSLKWLPTAQKKTAVPLRNSLGICPAGHRYV